MRKKKHNNTPRRKRMNHKRRMVAGAVWVKDNPEKNLVKRYARWFGVDLLCAIKELRLLGRDVSTAYETQVKANIAQKIQQRRKKKEERRLKEAALKAKFYLLNPEWYEIEILDRIENRLFQSGEIPYYIYYDPLQNHKPLTPKAWTQILEEIPINRIDQSEETNRLQAYEQWFQYADEIIPLIEDILEQPNRSLPLTPNLPHPHNC